MSVFRLLYNTCTSYGYSAFQKHFLFLLIIAHYFLILYEWDNHWGCRKKFCAKKATWAIPLGIVYTREHINVITFLFVLLNFEMLSFESAVFLQDGRPSQIKKKLKYFICWWNYKLEDRRSPCWVTGCKKMPLPGMSGSGISSFSLLA